MAHHSLKGANNSNFGKGSRGESKIGLFHGHVFTPETWKQSYDWVAVIDIDRVIHGHQVPNRCTGNLHIKDGKTYVITAAHCTEYATAYRVTTAHGGPYNATVHAVNEKWISGLPQNDVAILVLDGTTQIPVGIKIKWAAM